MTQNSTIGDNNFARVVQENGLQMSMKSIRK
jgi:hypothetical protein